MNGSGGLQSLDWLGLVIDRTCPDRAHWSDARSLLYNPPMEDSIAPGLPAYADYNLAIRQAVAQVLTSLPPTTSTQVHLSWFGDGPGEGMSAPDWVIPPMTLAGEFQPCSAARAIEHLRFCTYAPGLDLFDPLGEALQFVAEALFRQPRGKCAILILGNSPPDLPVEGDSALYDLLSFRGLESTVRRRCARFLPVLRELARRGIPVGYLFLTHDQCAPGEEENLLLYQELESRVVSVLEQYLSVVRVSADLEGIVQGFHESFRSINEKILKVDN